MRELLARAHVAAEAIDLFVFHQANEYMLRFLQKTLKIPTRSSRSISHIRGNTVSSTIPIALQHHAENASPRGGDLVMAVGFGVGYSWGANLIRWQPDK